MPAWFQLVVACVVVCGMVVGLEIGRRQRRALAGALAGMFGPLGWWWLVRSGDEHRSVWCASCVRATPRHPMPSIPMGGYSSHPHLRCDHCGSIIPETGDEVRFSVAVGSDERPPIVSVIWRRGWYDVTTVRSADQHIPRRVERAIDRAIRRRARRGRRWLSPLTISPAGIDEALDAAFGDDATVRVEGRRR